MQVVTDVACPACGCVCDDLQMTVENNRLVRIEPPCPLAEQWYRGINDATPPAAMIDDREVTLDAAVEFAARLLKPAVSPLIYGLSRSSTAGQRAAVALAEQLGATIDTTASLCHGPAIMALQQVGEATSTLGEVRNRADLVIFWGSDPQRTHPRHLERYSAMPIGEFLPRGRADRTIVVIDSQPNSSCAEADLFLSIEPNRHFETLARLRWLVREIATGESGAPFDDPWQDLARRMLDCQCGAVFFGLGLSQSSLGHHSVAELLRLVAELNAHTRFYARRMRLHGDVTGADNVLCWQTGFPFSVNLACGYPRYNPSEYSAHEMLSRGEVDACVLVGTETLDWFPPQAVEALRQIPTVVLDYPHVAPPFTPTVLFRTAIYGVHRPGTVYRMDEVPIPLRSFLDTDYPTDEDVLERIIAACSA